MLDLADFRIFCFVQHSSRPNLVCFAFPHWAALRWHCRFCAKRGIESHGLPPLAGQLLTYARSTGVWFWCLNALCVSCSSIEACVPPSFRETPFQPDRSCWSDQKYREIIRCSRTGCGPLRCIHEWLQGHIYLLVQVQMWGVESTIARKSHNRLHAELRSIQEVPQCIQSSLNSTAPNFAISEAAPFPTSRNGLPTH